MKRNIRTRGDIELLVKVFYDKVKLDPVIGPVFTTAIRGKWEKHLSVVADFWENALFFTGVYVGNPIASLRKLHKTFTLYDEHFNHWVDLFTQTIDELFEGEKASLAKTRAHNIATVMKIKVLQA